MRYITSFGHPPPDLDFITDSLAVGGALRSDEQINALPGLGIGSVVDVRSESQDDVAKLRALDIHFLHLPTKDWTPLSPEDMERGVDWVLDEMAAGRKVLVHCQHGIGRSVILVAAVLVKMGYTWQEAMMQIKAKRMGAGPHGDQIDALIAFAQGQRKPVAVVER
jgi:protein-tyrosine phosphatase